MPASSTILLTTPVVDMKTVAAHTLVSNNWASSARVYPLRVGVIYTTLTGFSGAPVVEFYGSSAGAGGIDIVTAIVAGPVSYIYELIELPLGDSGGNRYVLQCSAGPIQFGVATGATGTTVEGFAWMLAAVSP